MLVTLDELKTYLGIPLGDATYDDFLNLQNELISSTIESYCGRKFLSDQYIQTIYNDELKNTLESEEFYLFHFPLITLDGLDFVEKDNEGNDTTTIITSSEYRLHKPSSRIINTGLSGIRKRFFATTQCPQRLEITYTAGYADTPSPIKQAVYALVEERYNKNLASTPLNFGNNVQRISIPGTIGIDFDYTLSSNERKSTYGMILGDWGNVLDVWRSERQVVGEVRHNYVEETP